MPDSNPNLESKKLIELLEEDTVDNLKRMLSNANLMVMAIMDTLNVSEVTLNHKALLLTDGGLESYYDFDTLGYVVRRIK